MKVAHIGVLLLAAVFVSGSVSGKDLSKYPCTVFSHDACFRLPVGTSVDLSIPADFQLYTVSKGETSIATIYIGDAPQDIESSTAPKVIKTPSGTISVYGGQTAEGRIEVTIKTRSKEASTVHVSSTVPLTNNELRELLSSFRPCTPIKSGGQKCPVNAEWSNAINQALSTAR